MEQVGRYRLLEQIGRTDVASIHRAYEVTGGGLVRPVTLKRMLPDHARRFDRDAVLVEEARIGEQLDHPNVVRVIDLDQIDGIWFAVEERIEGRDLGTMLGKARQRGQKIDHDAGLFIAMQLLQALAHAHRRTAADGRPLGIVHRDVAPQNVWIGYDGEVRLGGFGYAQIEGRPPPGQPGLDTPRLGYVSPEQALGNPLDHRADLFAVGLILWELIAGRPAYESSSDADLAAKAKRGSVPGIRALVPDAGPEIQEVIEKATAFNREQRHGSAQSFRDELARILFKREPTYAPSHLSSTVARILGDEAAEDRKKDAEARSALKNRGVASLKTAPAQTEPPRSAPPGRPAPDPIAPAPVLGSAVEPEQSAAAEPFHYAPDPSAPQPPQHFPQPDLDAKPSFGKLVAGVSVLALVGIAVFAFSSEANMRTVKRKAREAVFGRKPGGQLTIDSVPEGARVFFDDEPTGKFTPITIENVESQIVHIVKLELEGERPITATVSVTANAHQKLRLTFEDAIVDLDVTTKPPGAEVIKDGRSVALSPASLLVRTGEPFQLAIKKAGYKMVEQEITPERGRPITIDLQLEKTEELLAAEAAERAALRAEERRNRKKKRRQR